MNGLFIIAEANVIVTVAWMWRFNKKRYCAILDMAN